MDQTPAPALNWTISKQPEKKPLMTPGTHHRLFAAAVCLPLLLTACATTPDASDSTAPAVAAAKSFQLALANQNFDAAHALIADDFSSPAWRTREDFRVYLVQARDRGYFAPATLAGEQPQGTVSHTVIGDHVRVYPVGLRSRAGVAVFDLMLAPRDGEWKIVYAALEYY
jgi:hypothetical protein